jgi:hypothetical protein
MNTQVQPRPETELEAANKLRPEWADLRSQWLRPGAGTEFAGDNFAITSNGRDVQHRIGIYAYGSSDLNAIFACIPLIKERLNGTCCILAEGNAATARSDILLQALAGVPEDRAQTIVEGFHLPRDVFEPRLFETSFAVPVNGTIHQFPKTVVALSIGADLTRVLYGHREHGILVDPGAAWVDQPMNKVLADLAAAPWFREQFVSLGRISVDAFAQNFSRVVSILQQRGIHVLVCNFLSVEPRSTTHTYQFVTNPMAVRRREFALALVELSRALDFSIVDVDRCLKRVGVRSQVDWGHPHPDQHPVLAREVVRILQDRGVLEACAHAHLHETSTPAGVLTSRQVSP